MSIIKSVCCVCGRSIGEVRTTIKDELFSDNTVYVSHSYCSKACTNFEAVQILIDGIMTVAYKVNDKYFDGEKEITNPFIIDNEEYTTLPCNECGVQNAMQPREACPNN